MPCLSRAALAFASTLVLGACATTGTPGSANPTALEVDVPTIRHPAEETPQWWFRDGAAQAAERGAMGGHAKNVILFVGDGMSLTTVAAARILDGQRKGGQMDAAVVVMDGLLLILFIVPGLVAFVIDLSTGAIYLPHGRNAQAVPADAVPRALPISARTARRWLAGELSHFPDAATLAASVSRG